MAADLSPVFHPLSFDDLPGWREDRLSRAFAAFRRSAEHVRSKPYRTGSLGAPCESFAEAHAAALVSRELDAMAARAFFEQHFIPCKVLPGASGTGFVTSYYEPEIEASRERTDKFTVPLYGRPPDLVDLDENNRPAGMDPYFAFGRQGAEGISEYPDRRAIEAGALSRRGLELAWLPDKVDAFFIHVQGAAKLNLTDGTVMRVTYAAKSGHPFTGPGRILVELGEVSREAVTMQEIRRWFRRNPDRIDEILWQNRSFIFFRETPVGEPELGPIAAAKVQLEPGRSLAVDRLLHTFGTPFFINAPSLTAFENRPFRRLMIAQDTGSAITGPARGDIFAGCGAAAGEIAGTVRHPADFYTLLPKELVGGRI
ncbi:MAG TPA: murein transglycosylase A [Rhizobiaceae bacterium]|nr:murein transglycosylase A [Rhizobiaceae bacterium]